MKLLEPSERATANERGYLFDPDSGMASTFNRDHRYKAAGLTLCLVYSPEREPVEYLLFKDGKPFYNHTNIEAIGSRADVEVYLSHEERSDE